MINAWKIWVFHHFVENKETNFNPSGYFCKIATLCIHFNGCKQFSFLSLWI